MLEDARGDGDIGRRVKPHELGTMGRAVEKHHFDLFRPFDNGKIREHVPLLGEHDP